MEAPHRFAAEHPVGELAAWFARRPAAALVVLALLVAASIAGLVGSAPEESLETGPAWEAAQRTRSEFDLDRRGGLLALFGEVALSEGGGALAGEELERALRALERDLEALPWIEDLVLPWDLPGASGMALAAIVARHPAVGEQLVLEGRGLLVPIVFPASGPRADALPTGADWAPALEDAARASLARAGVGARLEVGVTGTDAIVTAQQRAFEGERLRFMLGGALLGFVLASLAFRNVRATFLAGLPPLLGLGSDGFRPLRALV